MSTNWVKDIADMHKKFGATEWMENNKDDADLMKRYFAFRYGMALEEMEETFKAAFIERNAEEVVDGIVDNIVFLIGTLDILGVDSQKAWDTILGANMSKEPGVKPGRPNTWGMPDMIKPSGWRAPEHTGNTGHLKTFL